VSDGGRQDVQQEFIRAFALVLDGFVLFFQRSLRFSAASVATIQDQGN
jgi:hypothetical protein